MAGGMLEAAGVGIKRTVMIGGVEHFLVVDKENGVPHVILTDPDENRYIGRKRGDCHKVVDLINEMLGEI